MMTSIMEWVKVTVLKFQGKSYYPQNELNWTSVSGVKRGSIVISYLLGKAKTKSREI